MKYFWQFPVFQFLNRIFKNVSMKSMKMSTIAYEFLTISLLQNRQNIFHAPN